jgi:hypothetical protein
MVVVSEAHRRDSSSASSSVTAASPIGLARIAPPLPQLP